MNHIIGLDEVGYGSWAGPIAIGAVRAPADWTMPGLNDSKKLDRELRAKLSQELLELERAGTIQTLVVLASNEQIDKLGLGVCHKTCFVEAINKLYTGDEEIILDGNLNPKHFVKYGIEESRNMRSEIEADGKFPTVMAASIIAKHFRDELMAKNYHPYNPEYGWDANAGYIVPFHREAVKRIGLSSLHRKSYKVKL